MIDSFIGEYRDLSNFAFIPTFYEEIYYPTSEHAFQAAKTLDKAERQRIAGLSTPRDAKRAGREVNLRTDWEDVKYDVMLDILRNKFSSVNPAAQKLLLSTGDAELIEGNTWHDNCWGNCSCDKCYNIEGLNLLGKALMQVRAELRMSN